MSPSSKQSITKSSIEKIHDWICMIVILGIFSYTMVTIFKIPDRIPTHYNAKGEADHWGSKWSIFVPFGLMEVVYFFMSFFQKHPEMHNMPGRRTARKEHISRLMLSWLKLEVVLILAFIIWNSIRDAMGGSGSIGIWFLPVMGVVLIGTLVVSLVLMLRKKGIDASS